MKLLAIVPVRNEEWILCQNLQVLSRLCDAVFVADQRSTDRTPEICRQFDKVHYLRNDAPYPNSENRRQILLDATRSYNGCNIILTVDADEIMTATALTDPAWPRLLNSLEAGDSVVLQWVMLWKHPRRYRDDNSVWADRWVTFLFRDDRQTNYGAGNWHEPRVPQAFTQRARRFESVKVLHYQFVAWERMLSKQAHCRILEVLRSSRVNTAAINERYIITKDERRMTLRDVPPSWIDPWEGEGIDLAGFHHPGLFWYDIESLRFFSAHGTKCFAGLDIWDVDWEGKRQLALSQGMNGIPDEPIRDPRNIEQKLYHTYLNRYISTPPWRRPRELAKRIPGVRTLYRKLRASRSWLVNRLIDVSVWNYRLREPLTPRLLLSIPTVHTVGDALLHFHYTKLLAEEQGRPAYCLTPEAFPSASYVRFMFREEEYAIYSEPLYDKVLAKLPEKFWIDYWLLGKLKRKFWRYNPLEMYKAGYSKERDPIYQQIEDKDSRLAQAYLWIQTNDSALKARQEYFRLVMERCDGSPTKFPGFSETHRARLYETLGLKRNYVCLHIRPYAPSGEHAYDSHKETDPRGVHHVENYIPVVKLLTERGYQVVRMGKRDTVKFPEIDGYIDYANGECQSILNDLHLASGCVFFISRNSGPEMFPIIFRRPILRLNAAPVAWACGSPEFRFYPKTIVDQFGSPLSIKELLDHEVVYAQSADPYNRSGLRTVDLTADELVEATEEMLRLIENPATDWTCYTELQKGFRRMVRPEHLTLYTTLGAPCDSYLRKAMVRTERRPG